MEHPLTNQLKTLPKRPGVYLYKDKTKKVLYVGKAKNLFNRVRSYFNNFSTLSPAKQEMIKQTKRLDYFLVTDETEALLLETRLIKTHRPPYNIVWKDDKSFLYVKLDEKADEPLSVSRQVDRQAIYYGPYPNAGVVRRVLSLLKRTFLKGWRWPLIQEQSTQAKQAMVAKLKNFLDGNYQPIRKQLKREMAQAAQDRRYELAARLRDQWQAVQAWEEQAERGRARGASADYLSVKQINSQAAVNLCQVRHGQIINQEQWLLQNTQDSTETGILTRFLVQYYQATAQRPKQIVVGVELLELTTKTVKKLTANQSKLVVAKRGEKKKLLELGETNAELFLKQELVRHQPTFHPQSALKELKQALLDFGVAIPPGNKLKRIEGYDISNIQGSFPVGSLVVLTNGQPDKSQYRKFMIKKVKGVNDFAMLAELLDRRLKHSFDPTLPKNKRWPKPDLLVIDGGQGQLSAVEPVIKQWAPALPVIALAKQQEEIFKPRTTFSLKLPKDSPALQLLQRLRDESHRFAVSFYRQKHRQHLTA